MGKCPSNEAEIHQSDKCLGSWMGPSEEISFPKGTRQTRNTTSPRRAFLTPKQKKRKKKWYPSSHHGKAWPEESVFDFSRRVSSSDFTEAITGNNRSGPEQRDEASRPHLWLFWPGHALLVSRQADGLRNAVVNVPTARKGKEQRGEHDGYI